MSVAEFIEMFSKSEIQSCLFHFTDRQNLASITQHGLISRHGLEAASIAIPRPGGNQLSVDLDRASGLLDFVHLSFTSGNPMRERARADGRLLDPIFIRVDPAVLLQPGAMVTLNIANTAGVPKMTLENALPQMDLEVLCKRTKWSDPAINARRQIVDRYEALIPRHVPLRYLVIP